MERMRMTATEEKNGITVYLNGVTDLRTLLAMHSAVTYAVMDKLASEGGMGFLEMLDAVSASCGDAAAALSDRKAKGSCV